MFDRISNGFSLARSSWGVLVKDKHLIVFPIVSGIPVPARPRQLRGPARHARGLGQFEKQMQANNNRPPVWIYAVVVRVLLLHLLRDHLLQLGADQLRHDAVQRRRTVGRRRVPDGDGPAAADLRLGARLRDRRRAAEGDRERPREGRLLRRDDPRHRVVDHDVLRRAGAGGREDRADRGGRPVGVAAARRRGARRWSASWGSGFILFLLFIPVILLFVVGIRGCWRTGMVPVGIALLVVGVIALLLHWRSAPRCTRSCSRRSTSTPPTTACRMGSTASTFEGAFQPKPA